MELKDDNYTYDCFENCPACDEWRMRVRIKVFVWVSRSNLFAIPSKYFLDLRCLNCGYSNRFSGIDPIFFKEEGLGRILVRERQRLQEIDEATERSRSVRR